MVQLRQDDYHFIRDPATPAEKYNGCFKIFGATKMSARIQVAARVLKGDHQWLADEVLGLSCESQVFQMRFAAGDPLPANSR